MSEETGAVPGLDPEELNPDKGTPNGRGPNGRFAKAEAKPAADAPPAEKRPPGRPKGSLDKEPRKRPPAALEREIGGFLFTLSTVVSLTPLRGDALEEVEIALLASALNDQCTRSPRFRRWVERAISMQGGYSLLVAVAMIGGRRAVRHGLVPNMTPEDRAQRDLQMGGLVALMAGDEKAKAQYDRALAELDQAIARAQAQAEAELRQEAILHPVP